MKLGITILMRAFKLRKTDTTHFVVGVTQKDRYHTLSVICAI